MPTNKNALIRYKYLDRLLSDHHHCYDIHDVTDKVNDMLYDDGFPEVTQCCIEKDLNTLEYAPFNALIERFRHNGKNCISYETRSFSIFKQEMSREERNLLSEVLSTLFDNISNEVVIRLSYHTFSNPTIRSIVFHPYLLKQYNDRWFLLGAADSDKKILTFALDRIDEVEPLPEKKYEEFPDDLAERFKNIVGGTLYEDCPVEHILFWVNDSSKDYILTKPIHVSQEPQYGEKELHLRELYPQLEGGALFTIECIQNYEIIRELCSYGKKLIVLHSDGKFTDDVYNRICDM